MSYLSFFYKKIIEMKKQKNIYFSYQPPAEVILHFDHIQPVNPVADSESNVYTFHLIELLSNVFNNPLDIHIICNEQQRMMIALDTQPAISVDL